jgi:hypothetical protein
LLSNVRKIVYKKIGKSEEIIKVDKDNIFISLNFLTYIYHNSARFFSQAGKIDPLKLVESKCLKNFAGMKLIMYSVIVK